MDEILLVHHLDIIRLTQGLETARALDTLEVESVVTPAEYLPLDVSLTNLEGEHGKPARKCI